VLKLQETNSITDVLNLKALHQGREKTGFFSDDEPCGLEKLVFSLPMNPKV
jgi:hypothetical protein